jgi:hypothetical protein
LADAGVKPPTPGSPSEAFVQRSVRKAFEALSPAEQAAYLAVKSEAFVAPSDRPRRAHNAALLEGLRAAGETYRAMLTSGELPPPLIPIAAAYHDDTASREGELNDLDLRPSALHHARAYLRDVYGPEALNEILKLYVQAKRKLDETRECAELDSASKTNEVTGAAARVSFDNETKYGFGGTQGEWGADKNRGRVASLWRSANRLSDEDARRIVLGREAEAFCGRHGVRLADVAEPLIGRPGADDPRRLKGTLAVYLVGICGATETEAGELIGMAQQNVSKALRKKRV